MHHVVEILQIPLMHAKRERAQTGKDIAEIVEEHALHVFVDKWESQLGLVEQESMYLFPVALAQQAKVTFPELQKKRS